ncbi:hypothetical protein [Natrinema salsiterrestre]|uniref:Uncharacterized protein n=1 Tax=Natrinema salsiterrestre TaxID=2950540 RepID=A0A9Q4L080_9EURY|nr:hypothetical protein [Natrinema salsiterrestre]MDF9744889.1 hypothetical protein [Natrinema salsiterrestre]
MAVAVLVVVLISLGIPLVLWLAISQETSNPTVVDRAEAERIAKERGGRETSRSPTDADWTPTGDDRAADGHRDHRAETDSEEGDWPTNFDRDERDDGWGNRRT